MSRPELAELLREATPGAPASLRAQVRELAAAAAPPPRRRPGWRLALAGFAIAAVAAAVSAALLIPGGSPRQATGSFNTLAPGGPVSGLRPSASHGPAGEKAALPAASAAAGHSAAIAGSAIALPPPSTTRAQRYGATLYLRLKTGPAVAAAARRAAEIAQELGGYLQSTNVSVAAATGSATVVLRVPRLDVGTAVGRLSALGAVVGEQVSISDLQSGVNATGIRISQLEHQLDAARHAPKTASNKRLVAALTAQILGLQRARSATLRGASDATVTLHLATPEHRRQAPQPRKAAHGPFHELGVVFRHAGIVAVYVLALGAPLVALAAIVFFACSRLRRRREERLLSRS